METFRALDADMCAARTNKLGLKPLIDVGLAISHTPQPNKTDEWRPQMLTAPTFQRACGNAEQVRQLLLVQQRFFAHADLHILNATHTTSVAACGALRNWVNEWVTGHVTEVTSAF